VAVKGGACAIATRRSFASALDRHGDDGTMTGGPGGRQPRPPSLTMVTGPGGGPAHLRGELHSGRGPTPTSMERSIAEKSTADANDALLRSDLAGGNQCRSNSPAFTTAVDASHSSGATASFGPSGSFESRTATMHGEFRAMSTHCPPLPLLRDDLRHTARITSAMLPQPLS
jgi:hypothetical protein